MNKLSTGDDATLGNYRKLTEVFLGPKALAFIDQKIKENPNGENEEVLVDERQMIWLLVSLDKE